MRRTFGAIALTAIALVPFACHRATSTAATTAPSASASASIAAFASAPPSTSVSAATSASVDPLHKVPWFALVAAEAWEPAARALDLLPEADRGTPSAKLARLRIAVGRCTREEGERAVSLAEALASVNEVPIDVLTRLRIDALICAGRAKDALAITGPQALAARKGARHAVVRARALEDSGDLAGARVALGEAIDGAAAAGLPTGSLIASRLRVLRKLPVSVDVTRAIDADRKRLFIEFPLAFDTAVKQGEPAAAPPIDVNGWFKRADVLAGLGRGEDAMHAIDAAASAGAAHKRVVRARGRALFRARSWLKAATALKESAALGQGDDAIEDAFLAARAISRSGDDDAAIPLYEALAKKHPATRFGAEAAYLAAHLRWLRGQWQESILAFDRYLQGPFAKGPNQEGNAREAKRQRAFAYLEWGKHNEARRLFKLLAGSSEYANDAYARGRIELLEAIAMERAGDKSSAAAVYAKLATARPYGYFDLVARGRRVHLAEPVAAWPVGPLQPLSPPAFAPEVRLLVAAGLSRDALAVISLPKDEAAHCAIAEQFDDGFGAYKIGLKLASDVAPDADNAWKWRCAWPSPYAPLVSALEAREGLPHGLMHAILRQESAFRVDVVSPAGAVGIAQLMPATAQQTAAPLGMTLDPTDIAALQAPYLQLDLAARHLHALFTELAGEGASEERKRDVVPLVAAAYNAGAASVKRWLNETKGMEADVFIERTPYIETRGYVARVLGNLVRYAVINGAPTPTLPRKFPEPPP